VDPSIGIAEVGSKIDLLDMNTPFNKLNTSQALLTSLEKDFLDSNGYLSLGRLLSDERLDAIKTRVGELVNEEGDQGGSELFNSKHIKHPKEEGADRLANLVNKGEEFDILYTHQKLLAAVYHVLGAEVKISSLNYRAARPAKACKNCTSIGKKL